VRAGTISKQRGGEEAQGDGDYGHKSVRADVRGKVSKEKSGSLKCRRSREEDAADDADVNDSNVQNVPTEPQPVYSWRGVVDAARAVLIAAAATQA
jgi:hypothetical protein